MLTGRLVSAAIIIVILVALIGLDFQLGRQDSLARPGMVLAAIAIVVAMLSASELHALLRHEGSASPLATIAISAVAVGVCSIPIWMPGLWLTGRIGIFGWTMMALTLSIGLTFLIGISGYREGGGAARRAATSTLVHSHIILLFGFLVAHRLLGGNNALGLIALLALITSVKMSDAAAYFTGKSIGTIKLAPRLSPGKTVQGALGGLVGAWLGAAIIVYGIKEWLLELDLSVPFWWLVAYGVAVTAAGIVGDLSVSLFKRDANLKDSSNWLPGLGGIVDITDSLVFAAPISYLFWVCLPWSAM